MARELFPLLFLHHIRDIKDPEHPYSLEELKVVTEDSVEVDDKRSHVRITFTPTVEHCSMATVIGLCLRVKLLRSLPSHYKVDIRVAPGTHATEAAVNKQLNDKERVAAALENPNLVDMVDECLANLIGKVIKDVTSLRRNVGVNRFHNYYDTDDLESVTTNKDPFITGGQGRKMSKT
ncbi:hypothetical protein KSS87_018903 [Heliosperma pusillum]|nr:hypothetical protein KSS87_018903 [Heliosperma pusillum]